MHTSRSRQCKQQPNHAHIAFFFFFQTRFSGAVSSEYRRPIKWESSCFNRRTIVPHRKVHKLSAFCYSCASGGGRNKARRVSSHSGRRGRPVSRRDASSKGAAERMTKSTNSTLRRVGAAQAAGNATRASEPWAAAVAADDDAVALVRSRLSLRTSLSLLRPRSVATSLRPSVSPTPPQSTPKPYTMRTCCIRAGTAMVRWRTFIKFTLLP